MSLALDNLAPNFRRATMHWRGGKGLVAHYETLSAAFEGNQYSLVDLTKSFVECLCRTILTDYGQSPASNMGLTELLKNAAAQVGLEHQRGASKYNKVLSAYFKLSDAINDLRNNDGAISHGKDGFLDDLCENHQRILVVSADAIVALLLGAMDGREPDLNYTRRPFDTFEHLNRVIDAGVSCAVDLIEPEDTDGTAVGPTISVEFMGPGGMSPVPLLLRPSELLFMHDRQAYVELLNEVRSAAEAGSFADGKDAP